MTDPLRSAETSAPRLTFRRARRLAIRYAVEVSLTRGTLDEIFGDEISDEAAGDQVYTLLLDRARRAAERSIRGLLK